MELKEWVIYMTGRCVVYSDESITWSWKIVLKYHICLLGIQIGIHYMELKGCTLPFPHPISCSLSYESITWSWKLLLVLLMNKEKKFAESITWSWKLAFIFTVVNDVSKSTNPLHGVERNWSLLMNTPFMTYHESITWSWKWIERLVLSTRSLCESITWSWKSYCGLCVYNP